jgi:hypothetical protein
MNAKIFIATSGQGLARAERDGNGSWSVELSLADQDVRSLASDPSNPDVVFAGTQGEGVLRSEDHGDTGQKLAFNLGGIHRTLITL